MAADPGRRAPASARPGGPRRDRTPPPTPPRPCRRNPSRTRFAETWVTSWAWLVHTRCREAGSEPAQEPGDGLADLGWRVLLEEVAAAHGDLLLIGPGAAEPARRADQDRARIAVDEELGQRALGQPLRVGVDQRGHVGRLAVDRDLARPSEGGPTRLAGPARR